MRAAAALHGVRRRIGRRAATRQAARREGLRVNVVSVRRAVKALLVRRVAPRAIGLSAHRADLKVIGPSAHRDAKVSPAHRAAPRANVLNARRAAKVLRVHLAVPKAIGPNARRAVKAPAARHAALKATVASGRHVSRAMTVRVVRPPVAPGDRAEQTTHAVPAAHPSGPALALTAQAPSRAARSTGRRATKARGGVRPAAATSVRLRRNAASARSHHP